MTTLHEPWHYLSEVLGLEPDRPLSGGEGTVRLEAWLKHTHQRPPIEVQRGAELAGERFYIRLLLHEDWKRKSEIQPNMNGKYFHYIFYEIDNIEVQLKYRVRLKFIFKKQKLLFRRFG
jgi:hypothetical protein